MTQEPAFYGYPGHQFLPPPFFFQKRLLKLNFSLKNKHVTIIIHLVLIIKKQSKMKKVNWKTIINFLITVLTAVASSFCVQNC